MAVQRLLCQKKDATVGNSADLQQQLFRMEAQYFRDTRTATREGAREGAAEQLPPAKKEGEPPIEVGLVAGPLDGAGTAKGVAGWGTEYR